MRSNLLLIFLLSVCSADNEFDDELYRSVLDSTLCKRQLKTVRRFEFNDASFRAPEGILVGNLASLGNYHQCLAINQHLPDTNIQGKYCLIRAPVTLPTIRIPSLTGVSVSENVTWTEMTLPEDQMQKFANKSLSLAVCVPKSCTVEPVLAPYTEHPVLGFNYTEQYCRLPNDKPFSAADYVATIIFSLLGFLTLISTAYEMHHIFILRKEPAQASDWLRACSLYTNTRRLLSSEKSRRMQCLDGIRSISILWIILFHNYHFYFLFANYVANSFEVLKWTVTMEALWVMPGNLAVDSFLTLSGLLLVYTIASKMEQATLLKNLHLFYLNRYLRLFPLLATAVLLQASLMHRVSDGPNWHTVAAEVRHCRRYWWSALLHVQNYVNNDNICLIPTWYLSVDMQLYVISPLVLYWVLGSRRAACVALGTAILTSLAATLAFCLVYDFAVMPYIQIRATLDEWNNFSLYYSSPVTRSSPFFIGMLLGYVLRTLEGQKIKLSQWIVYTCHCLALSIFIYSIYIVYPSFQEEWDNPLIDSMTNTFRRPCWSLALCWLIFACVHGYGGPVNWFLSLGLWKFVSRISYAMYLIHTLVQNSNIGSAVAPIYFNMATMSSLLAYDLVFTLVFSTAACVLIEEPALMLQRKLLRGATKSREKQNEDTHKSASNEEEFKNHL